MRDSIHTQGSHVLISIAGSNVAISVSNATSGVGPHSTGTYNGQHDNYYGITFVQNTWQHICLMWSGSNTSLYIDGVERAPTADANFNIINHTSTTDPLVAVYLDPYAQTSWYTNHLQGEMQNLRLYHRVLTPAEIGALATTTITY